MITLEQIQLLEKRVRAAVSRIASLKHENELLKEKLQKYETRFTELEQKISQYKQDQSDIEQGIMSALEQLDHIEDEVLESSEGEKGPGSAQSDSSTSAGEAVTEEIAEDADSQRPHSSGGNEPGTGRGLAPETPGAGDSTEVRGASTDPGASTEEESGRTADAGTESLDREAEEPSAGGDDPAGDPILEENGDSDVESEKDVTVEDAQEEEEDQGRDPSDELDIF